MGALIAAIQLTEKARPRRSGQPWSDRPIICCRSIHRLRQAWAARPPRSQKWPCHSAGWHPASAPGCSASPQCGSWRGRAAWRSILIEIRLVDGHGGQQAVAEQVGPDSGAEFLAGVALDQRPQGELLHRLAVDVHPEAPVRGHAAELSGLAEQDRAPGLEEGLQVGMQVVGQRLLDRRVHLGVVGAEGQPIARAVPAERLTDGDGLEVPDPQRPSREQCDDQPRLVALRGGDCPAPCPAQRCPSGVLPKR